LRKSWTTRECVFRGFCGGRRVNRLCGTARVLFPSFFTSCFFLDLSQVLPIRRDPLLLDLVLSLGPHSHSASLRLANTSPLYILDTSTMCKILVLPGHAQNAELFRESCPSFSLSSRAHVPPRLSQAVASPPSVANSLSRRNSSSSTRLSR
jgi:hypothetical protein